MAAWSGFTDEDLRKMRSQEGHEDDRRGAPSKRGMMKRPRGSAPLQKINRAPPAQIIENKTQVQENRMDDVGTTSTKVGGNRSNNTKIEDPSMECPDSEKKEQKSIDKDGHEKAPLPEAVELSTDEARSIELNNVAKFQQQQKVIEEANKQKRALLAKAIEERRKMAKAENQKLIKIQQELNHLDTLLNIDVGIIRDKIEVASLDFAQAQKRYEKAEKEFIDSKMDLFEKSETKERLTEHLYTIINQNEVRKAKKLVELMEQLAMEVSPEEMEMSVPTIPQLTNFTAISTLHQSGHHPRRESESAEDGNCKKKEGDKATEVVVGDGSETGDKNNKTMTNDANSEKEEEKNKGECDGEKVCADKDRNEDFCNNDRESKPAGEINDAQKTLGKSGSSNIPSSQKENELLTDKRTMESNAKTMNTSTNETHQLTSHPDSGNCIGGIVVTEPKSASPTHSYVDPSLLKQHGDTVDQTNNNLVDSKPDEHKKAKGWSLPFS